MLIHPSLILCNYHLLCIYPSRIIQGDEEVYIYIASTTLKKEILSIQLLVGGASCKQDAETSAGVKGPWIWKNMRICSVHADYMTFSP